MAVFAEAVRLRREELGLSQQDVAERLGVGQQAVSQWEAGASLPRPQRIAELASLYGVGVEELWKLAGFLPMRERSKEWTAFKECYATVAQLSNDELWLLADRIWNELRDRHGVPIDRLRRNHSAAG